ncbi:hypothetical protein F4775DRAFT_598717 [Biscogniauxia sp. FL1348]|nr:hypothetical protein F4775DRAFT_598717 [Biscogniauxia sp. FL1348]
MAEDAPDVKFGGGSETPPLDLNPTPAAEEKDEDNSNNNNNNDNDDYGTGMSLSCFFDEPGVTPGGIDTSSLRFLFIPAWDYQLHKAPPADLSMRRTVPLPAPLSRARVVYCPGCEVSWLRGGDPDVDRAWVHPGHQATKLCQRDPLDKARPPRENYMYLLSIGAHTFGAGFAVSAIFGTDSKYNVVEVVPRFEPPDPREIHMDPELRAVVIAATRALQRVRGNGDHRGFMPWYRKLGHPAPRVIIGTSSLELVRIMATRREQKPLDNWPRTRWINPQGERRRGVPLCDDGELEALCDERLMCLKDGIDVWWYLVDAHDTAPLNKIASYAGLLAYKLRVRRDD